MVCKFQHSQRFLGIHQPSPLAHTISVELRKRQLLNPENPSVQAGWDSWSPRIWPGSFIYLLSMAVFKLQRQSRVDMAEAIWSTKPEIFTI